MEPAASAQQRHRQLAKLFMAFTKIFQPTLNILLFMKEPQPTLRFALTKLDLDALHRVLADCKTRTELLPGAHKGPRSCVTRRALPGTGGHFQREATLPTGGENACTRESSHISPCHSGEEGTTQTQTQCLSGCRASYLDRFPAPSR